MTYEEVLEQRIEDAYQAFLTAQTPEGKQQHFQNMRALSYQLMSAKTGSALQRRPA